MSHQTQFVPLDTKSTTDHASLHQPILASFPQKLPQNIQDLDFTIYQHESSSHANASKKKRVIKARNKNIQYIASTTGHSVVDRNQGMDYYLGVISQKNDQQIVYTVPVTTKFQFVQEIEGFNDRFGA